MFSLEEIVQVIVKKTGMGKEDVNRKIEEKQTELSGLVSPEGAAYIVGKELGVSLLRETDRQLKINNVVPGMRSVDVVGRVLRVFEKRDFEKNGRKGSVLNLVLGDDSGRIRFSLWNEEIEKVKELDLKENDVLKVTRGFVVEDNRGDLELRLGKVGKLDRVAEDEVKIPKIEDVKKGFETAKRKRISDVRDGEFVEVKACLVQVFRRNPFFELCPECGSRLEVSGDSWSCKEHSKVEPKYRVVLSGFVDDDFGNIRAVFFGDLAEKVLGKGTKDLRASFLKHDDPNDFYDTLDCIGKEFVIRGNIKRNQFSERLELVANEVEPLNVKGECESLLKRIKNLSPNMNDFKV